MNPKKLMSDILSELSPKKWYGDLAKNVRNLIIVAFVAFCLNMFTGWYDAASLNISRFAELPAKVETVVGDLEQIRDELDSQRAESTQVVVWAESKSQVLTDLVGPCNITDGSGCVAVFRGRRTIEGIDCEVTGAEMRGVNSSGAELGIRIHDDFSPVKLGLDFKDIVVPFIPGAYLSEGSHQLFVVTFYSKCGFAREGEIVRRQTVKVRKDFVRG